MQPGSTEFLDPNCPTCATEVDPIVKTVSYQVETVAAIPPRIVETITPATYETNDLTAIKDPARIVVKSAGECGGSRVESDDSLQEIKVIGKELRVSEIKKN